MVNIGLKFRKVAGSFGAQKWLQPKLEMSGCNSVLQRMFLLLIQLSHQISLKFINTI